MRKTAWKLLNDHPPALIRLMARRKVVGKRVRAMSLQEIAIAAGMPLSRVDVIGRSVSWSGISVPEAERFCVGCGFDPLCPADRNRKSAYERSCKARRSKFQYLKDSPHWSEFLSLIRRLEESRKADRSLRWAS